MLSFDLYRWSRRRISSSMVASALVLLLFYSLINREGNMISRATSSLFKSGPHNTTLDLSHLQHCNISSQFTYARRSIHTKHLDGERPMLTTVNGTLFPTRQTFEKNNLSNREIIDLPPLTLYVPSPPNVDSSIISFGIATKIPRLNSSFLQLSHWLTPDTPLHVIAPPYNKSVTLSTQAAFHSLALNLTLETSDLHFEQAYFSLVKTLYESRTPKTQWLVLLDDDTFIPSLPILLTHLQKHYDPSSEQLIAAMSDDIDQIRNYGLIPFGGGGIFMSVPLAAKLSSPGVYNKCIASPKNQGDQIFNDCLNRFTSVKPIFDHGLNQMDINGDQSDTGPAAGYFESGRRMLTVHHWKSWFQINIPDSGVVSKACGDECIFMRWSFPESNMVLSNAFSIAEYAGGLGELEFEKVEKTWEGDESKFVHHIGPFRKALPKDVKASYKLLEADVLQGVGVRQVYFHEGPTGEYGQRGTGDVLELLWLF